MARDSPLLVSPDEGMKRRRCVCDEDRKLRRLDTSIGAHGQLECRTYCGSGDFYFQRGMSLRRGVHTAGFFFLLVWLSGGVGCGARGRRLSPLAPLNTARDLRGVDSFSSRERFSEQDEFRLLHGGCGFGVERCCLDR